MLSSSADSRLRFFTFALLGIAACLTAAPPTRLGDLNGDGISDVRDLMLIQGHANGTRPLTALEEPYADLTKDGAVNSSDVEELIKEILGTRTPEQLPLTTVQLASPSSGEMDVAVTRETILHFSIPLHPSTAIDTTRFFAEFGGRKILSRVEISSDREKATLFYLEPLPSNARLNVTLDGTGLIDLLGRSLDLDADTQAGGIFRMSFDTLSITGLAGTGVTGRVIASEKGAGGADVPIPGVTVTVDGAEQDLRAVTDAQGNFTLSPCPAGTFFVHIDGRTSTLSSWPDGAYYPFVGKKWVAQAGRLNNPAGDIDDSPTGPTGIIYLPRVAAGSLQAVSATQDTLITFPPEVTGANSALTGTQLIIPPNSLFADDGTRGGRIGIAPVPPDRLPGPLPPGLEPPMVITIQTDGATNFDQPVSLRFPNTQNLPPGTKQYLVSFNHDLGEWEPVGPMTVTEDGLFVKTDVGVGVVQPGWHGFGNFFRGLGSPAADGQGCRMNMGTCLGGAAGAGALCAATAGLLCWLGGAGAALYCQGAIESCISAGSGSRSARVFPVANSVELQVLKDFVSATLPINARIFELRTAQIVRGSLLASEQSELARLIDQRNATAGGDYSAMSTTMIELFHSTFPSRIETLEREGPFSYATFVNGQLVSRGRTTANGRFSCWVERSQVENTMVVIHDSKKNQIALAMSILDPTANDFSASLPYLLVPTTEMSDFDGDGLPDIVELVYATEPSIADTDNDGLSDGVEVQQGTNPLGGYIAQTGVIATAPTPSGALELDINNQLVTVAQGTAGIAIYDARAVANPTLIAQIDTPGFAYAVASEGNYLAVADDTGGLAIVELSDLTNLRINRQVRFNSDVRSVAVRGLSAFLGFENGSVVEVDLPTGRVLSTVTGSGIIEDLSVTEQAVYAVTRGSVRIYSSTAPGNLALVKSLSPGGNPGGFPWRLFVGGGLLYSSHGRGYSLYELTDPLNPMFLRRFDDSVFGWKQIVTTGTGIGVAAVGENSGTSGSHDVYLYDLGADGRSTSFVTLFPIDGIARAVGINNGLAYVAVEKRDGTGALQVVNYRSTDIARVPPSGTLATTAADNIALEGTLISIKANVTDDVQVRNVEFFADGQSIGSDGSFPFALPYTMPQATGEFIEISAVARDTGGTSFTLPSIQIQSSPDTTPPKVAIGGSLPTDLIGLGSDLVVDLDLNDNSGVLGMQVSFNLDGTSVSAIQQLDGSWVIRQPSAGDHVLFVTVSDRSGNTTSSSQVSFRIRSIVVSREVSTFGLLPEPDVHQMAVSREISTFRDNGASDPIDTVSREVSVQRQ